MRIHVNIGSNLGDRLGNICKAIAFFLEEEAIDPLTLRVSTPVESNSWGFDSPHRFLNIGISFSLKRKMHPEAVLKMMLHIQELVNGGKSHRDKAGRYIDRLLDIDVIDIDNLVYSSEVLTIPHPLARERDFVMVPWRELEGDI